MMDPNVMLSQAPSHGVHPFNVNPMPSIYGNEFGIMDPLQNPATMNLMSMDCLKTQYIFCRILPHSSIY